MTPVRVPPGGGLNPNQREAVAHLGERLDEGVLQLWAAAGPLPTAWEEQVDARFRVEVPRGRVRAAIDGEPAEFDSPFELESVPQALRVLVPARQAK